MKYFPFIWSLMALRIIVNAYITVVVEIFSKWKWYHPSDGESIMELCAEHTQSSAFQSYQLRFMVFDLRFQAIAWKIFFSEKKRILTHTHTHTHIPQSNDFRRQKFNRFDVTDTTVNIETLLCTGWIVCSSIHGKTKVCNIFSRSTGGTPDTHRLTALPNSVYNSVLHFTNIICLYAPFFSLDCSF